MHIPSDLYEKIKASLPIACVDLLIINNGCFLLVRRKNPPARGKWWFPGGRIHKWELILDAAVRKGKEELGLDLQPLEIISVEESIFNEGGGANVHTINFVVKMKITNDNQTIVLDNNHSEFAWFDSITEDLHQYVKGPLLKLNFPVNNNLNE